MNQQLPSLTSDESNVRITIPKQKLRDFIGDVLKTRRRVGKEFSAIFNVKKNDIIDIISVLDHRVREQNSADLVDLSIYVLYSDGSNREYTSLDQFETIDDNLKATSVTALVSLSY